MAQADRDYKPPSCRGSRTIKDGRCFPSYRFGFLPERMPKVEKAIIDPLWPLATEMDQGDEVRLIV